MVRRPRRLETVHLDRGDHELARDGLRFALRAAQRGQAYGPAMVVRPVGPGTTVAQLKATVAQLREEMEERLEHLEVTLREEFCHVEVSAPPT
jgi:methionine synthase I (cobalamin-dependent)